MASHRQTTSLNVQANRNQSESSGYPSTATEDAALLRESRQFRRDMEREAERWVDVLMESPSVDRRFLRRASLYLQPNLYDEVTHERHLVKTCSYPTCRNRPHRPFSDEQKWRITKSTTHNASIRGPNKRDIVEVDGNPEDGFCSPACAIRSRWYRSRLSVEPIWARHSVNAGDLKDFQVKLKEGRRVDPLPEEVDLLEDMEDKGEIVIEDGQIRRVSQADKSQPTCGASKASETSTPPAKPRTTESLPISELVAESREKPSSLMQRLEKTLADLRIVEKAADSPATSHISSAPSNSQSGSLQTQPHPPPSVSAPTTAPTHTRQGDHAVSTPSPHRNAKIPVDKPGVTTTQGTQTPKQPVPRRAQTDNGGDDDAEEESEDDETRMVFDLALAARGQLNDGTF